MKKTLCILAIVTTGFYYGINANPSDCKIVQSKYNHSNFSDEDTNKIVKQTDTSSYQDNTTEESTSEVSDNTQRVLDSINNVQGGSYYGTYNNSYTPAPEKTIGTREPNSYKSGRTGGQYDVVNKPGYTPKKKKNNDE